MIRAINIVMGTYFALIGLGFVGPFSRLLALAIVVCPLTLAFTLLLHGGRG